MKRLLALIVLVVALAACGGGAETPPATEPPPTAVAEEPTQAPEPTATEAVAEPTSEPAAEEEPTTGEPIKIGLLTDQSGALAIYGPQQENGFRLGLEYATNGTMQVAGRPIEVIVKDNASDPETAVSQARELISAEGVDVLVGTVSSGATLAVMEVAKENEKILIVTPAASPAITGENFNEFTFRTSRTSVQDALTMGAALVELGDTFVQIAPDYAFGYGSAMGFYNVVKSLGGQFVINDNDQQFGAIFIPQDTTDFTTYLNQVLDSGADVLIVTWAGAGFVPLFQQMQQLGIFDEMTVATGFGDNQTIAAGYTDAIGAVGVSVYHYTLPDNAVNDWLVQRHKEAFGVPPDLFTEGGFTAAQMLVAGLEATGGDTSAAALIPVLEQLRFQGPKGEYIVRPEDHVMLQPMYLVRLVNTDDPEFRFFELVREFGPEETAPPCQVPPELNRCP